MDQAVQNGIGEGGIPDDIVPVLEGELAGDEGGSSAGAVLDDLQEIAAFDLVQGSEAIIIDSQEVGLLKSVHQLRIGAIGTGQGHVLDEPCEAEVAAGEPLAAGGLSQSTSQVGLAGAGGSGDENDLMVTDPVRAGQAQDDRTIEAARGAQVEILDGGREPELGLAQQPGEAPILADRNLPLDEEGEAVLEGEALDIGHGLLFIECIGHAGEAEFAELGEGLLKKHGSGSQFQEL